MACSTRRLFPSLVLVVAAALAGCPSDPVGPPGVDAGPRADAPGLDAPGLDAPGLDAPGLDAPGLDAPGLDAPGLDAPTPAGCGNGTLERPAGEECDDGNTTSGDGCSATCRTETTGTCGNSIVEIARGEECDDGNTTAGDGCGATCQLEPVGASCGDGTVDSGEACDDSNVVNGDGCNPTCNLTNTTSVLAGTPGMTGRTDGVGAAARFTSTGVLAVDAQYLWMAEAPGMGGTPPAVLRRIEISTGTVLTVATILGSGGVATNGVDTVWVAGGNNIQSISTAPPYTITTIHSGVAATSAANFVDGAPGTASFADVRGLTWYGGFLWIVDTAAAVIRRMDPATGNVTTVAGSPYMAPAAGTDGVGAAARFTSPRFLVSDGSGTIYISDTNGAAIRAMNAGTFAVTTVAGAPGMAGYVDGVGAAVRVHRPRGITADGSSVYFCEFNAHTIRQVILGSGATSTLVGTADTTPMSTGGYAEGVGTAALIASPWGIAYHPPTRTIFFSDASRTIRRIR